MGLLDESNTYTVFETKDPFTLVGEVWAECQELRNFSTKYGEGDFLVIPVLPKGVDPSEQNVVGFWVPKGARMTWLTKAIKAAGMTTGEFMTTPGTRFAASWDGATVKKEMGPQKVWTFQIKRGTSAAAAGPNLLDGDDADTSAAEPMNLLDD